MDDIPTIKADDLVVVLGGSGRIGREVARLAVAYGSRVISFTREGAPPTQEPWTQGVEWRQANVEESDEWADDLSGLTAVINAVSTGAEVLRSVRSACSARSHRLVEIGCASTVMSAEMVDESAVHLRVPPFEPKAETGEIGPSESGIAVGHAAMAALRAGLEAEHRGILGPAEVAYLGDAMFIQ